MNVKTTKLWWSTQFSRAFIQPQYRRARTSCYIVVSSLAHTHTHTHTHTERGARDKNQHGEEQGGEVSGGVVLPLGHWYKQHKAHPN